MKKTLSLVAGLALAAAADASILYTIRTQDDMLVKIDTSNWSFTPVGPLGTGNFDFGDLAFDPDTGILYMVTGFAGFQSQFWNLYTVDVNTGAATLVGPHGLGHVFGLAFDDTGGFWASSSTTGQGFYSVNKNTGALTLIGNPGVNLDGITYDTTRGILVGLNAGPGSLHNVDRTTGAAPILSPGGGFVNNCGIAYDPSVDLIYAIDWSGQVYSFDPSNNYARSTVTSVGTAYDGLAMFVEATSCYADCDTSTGVGVLDIFDFLCFQNRFAAGSPYACDCDTQTGVGVCDIFDFLCFQNAFAAGCP